MKHATLWKRILNEGLRDTVTKGRPGELANTIIRSPIIVDERPINRLVFRWNNEYPQLAFPFPAFWVEMRDGPTGQLGGTMVAYRHKEGDEHPIVTMAVVLAPPRIGPDVFALIHFPVEKSGGLIYENSGEFRFKIAISDDARVVGEQIGHSMSPVAMGWVKGCLDTLDILGCKNVSLQPHDNDPKQVRRAIKRHGGTPDSYRYHTLVVRPAGSKPGTPGQEIGIMPRHVCRGHMMHFGPADIHNHPDGKDRGLLFGKYAGRFFMPPCAKGKKENGVVEKDYAIVGN